LSDDRQIKRRVSAEERRRLVVDAARAKFVELGYAGASMREIAKAADVREAVLYQHFSSKQELFEEAIAQPLEAAMNTQIELYSQPVDDGQEIRGRSELFIRDMLDAMQDVGPLLGAVLLSDRERATAFYRAHLKPALDRGRQETANNAHLWDARDFDADLAVRMAWATCWFLSLEQRLGEGITTPNDKLAEQIVAILYDGLRARRDD